MTEHPAIGGLPLVLGGNVFGWTAKGDDGFAVLDAFYEAGGRMIDTADVYSAWVPGNKGGESEKLIGQWLESRGVRSEMLIHTKTGMMGSKELYEAARVLRSLDESLERLRSETIDLYYAHQDFTDLPIDDIVGAFDGAIKSGKVRALGASKFTAGRLSAALEAAERTGAEPFSVLQNQYNLVERGDFEPDLQALCARHGIPLLPFFGLAAGYLSGKYRDPADLKGDRSYRVKDFMAKGSPVLAALDRVAAETGASLPAIALAWLRAQPHIPAPIASARSPQQLATLIESATLELSREHLDLLTAAAG
ncbi:aldo/keto reductase [Novosphingobium sp. Gsoil 351]|uniref:aldo/keto reductase n=1 Tax=Novosphingobium sp. Gsoil 351 TaxID=2675225 RepID=UPI0012B4B9A6|nr:aldo/keto reductase [Novosphingobium sp. Gsoil 351]QGN53867.1 aldo/keto reductase [Novosphingobium sp. Gsoil 351]